MEWTILKINLSYSSYPACPLHCASHTSWCIHIIVYTQIWTYTVSWGGGRI